MGRARARSAGSGRAGCAGSCAAVSAPDNQPGPAQQSTVKGGDGFDGNDLGGAADGRRRICLVPVCGTTGMARRGVHHIRFLSRVIQPRAGYREHHDEPVPAALAATQEGLNECRDQ